MNLTRKITTVRVLLTVLAGIALPYVCGFVLMHIGYEVLVLQVQLLKGIGIHSGARQESIIYFTDSFLWALMFGVLFGIPLAALVREQVLRYWSLFLITALRFVLKDELSNENGFFDVVFELVISQFPVYLIGILIVWLLTAKTLIRKWLPA